MWSLLDGRAATSWSLCSLAGDDVRPFYCSLVPVQWQIPAAKASLLRISLVPASLPTPPHSSTLPCPNRQGRHTLCLQPAPHPAALPDSQPCRDAALPMPRHRVRWPGAGGAGGGCSGGQCRGPCPAGCQRPRLHATGASGEFAPTSNKNNFLGVSRSMGSSLKRHP